MRQRAMLILAGLFCSAGVGCGPTLQPIDWPGQVVVKDGRAAAVTAEDVAVTVAQAELPRSFREGLLAIEVTVGNRSDRPVRLSYPHVKMIAGGDVAFEPVDPARLADALLGSYGLSVGEVFNANALADVRVGGGVTVVHGGYHWPRGRVGFRYRGFGYPGWWYGMDYYDTYRSYARERAEAVRFAMRLWDDRLVQPGSAERGVFVFDTVPDDEQLVRILIELADWTDHTGRPLPLEPEPAPEVDIRKYELRFRVD